jgi:hypothetical protein
MHTDWADRTVYRDSARFGAEEWFHVPSSMAEWEELGRRNPAAKKQTWKRQLETDKKSLTTDEHR